MIREFSISLPYLLAAEPKELHKACSRHLSVKSDELRHVQVVKRSIDSRSRNIKIHFQVRVFINEDPPEEKGLDLALKNVSRKEPVIIVGAGPAGLFAALQTIRSGRKPILIDRGKTVKERRRDLVSINRHHIVDPDSNYCFGEGGAGTYSDGKLYTRSHKRGDVLEVLNLLVAFGASTDILIDAHPHIGTNKLPAIIEKMRNILLDAGAEIHFEQRVNDLLIKDNCIKGLTTLQGKEFLSDKVILATGHSARDIFMLLHNKGVHIEAKPFALGVRVEHPQELIDKLQYHCDKRPEQLPPSSYALVHQEGKRGVYSFCMCPGGIIAPCATSPGEVVTNGWSPSKRNNPYANSGVVVSIASGDLKDFSGHGPLAGMYFQQAIERLCCEAAGGTQKVPAQRLQDFVNNKHSDSLPVTSYKPGLTSLTMDEVLPRFVTNSLREGFKAFGRKMKGYLTNEAVLHAVESRTSSPVRIPRNPETLEHVIIKGLYPCGEGAGYAGGIVSAAMDGMKVGEYPYLGGK